MICIAKHSLTANRTGAAAVMILLLTSLLFIAIVFSIDIARIQLAQLEMQSGVDFASRAGAEALARGVGDPNSNSNTDAMLRAEIDMIARLNSANGESIVLSANDDINFGRATMDSSGAFSVDVTTGDYDGQVDSVLVQLNQPQFPVVFGGFIGTESVNLSKSSGSMVSERDIVVILDRSTSMLKHDAGTLPVGQYNANLRELEDELYGPGEAFYPGGSSASANYHTEFEEDDGILTLSRTQALKLAVLNFRLEIDKSRGFEQLGLTTYSPSADQPNQAVTTSQNVDIIAGLSQSIFDQIVDDGITDGSEKFASALESHDTGYRNFDYNYLAMRRLGGTNIVDGLNKGADNLFGTGHRAFATPVLILMTDGNHNGSGDPVATATSLMASHPEMKIYTVSFGSGADQTTMQQIAQIGGGEHHHATDVQQLVEVFRDLANSAGVSTIQ